MTALTAFGLDIWSDEPPALLAGADVQQTGRVLDLLVDDRGLTCWPSGAGRLSAEHSPQDAAGIVIEHHPEAGYQISGARYGRHILSSDGRRLRCLPGQAASADWQRLLIAQVLPFAAALNGLEVLHASAVAFGARALALLGPSGSGKTSLALALCRLGAVMVADDVLAVERPGDDGARVLAHPGTPVAGVAHGEADRLTGLGHALSVLASNDRERLVRIATVRAPVQLDAMLFLHRSPTLPMPVSFDPVETAGALLGSTFNFVLDDPTRLMGLLDVCALLARGAVRHVRFGAQLDPDMLAATVASWFEDLQ